MTADRDHVARCACGQLRITARGDPDVVVACNCLECQRRTGAPFGVGAYYLKPQIVGTDGEASGFTRSSDSGRSLTYQFCPTCGTTVYWMLDMRPNHVGIALGCFADPQFAGPARTIWTENQHHWVTFPEDMPSFDKATPP